MRETMIFIMMLLLSMSIFMSSTAASSTATLIGDTPGVSVQGTGEDFNFPAWGGWWVRGGSTSIDFTFTALPPRVDIIGQHVEVQFNLWVTNHANGETGLDGLVDITINPGVSGWTYTVTDVLFDNLDQTNHIYGHWSGKGTCQTTASMLVDKVYILGTTLVVRVRRHIDTLDELPSAPVCTNRPIDMSTSPPTVPTGCYDYDDAHTVHINVPTTDATGTRAAPGRVTVYAPEGLIPPPVGGVLAPVDKLGLLAPYIGLASTIVVATAATAIYVKRVKRRKEKR